MKGHEIYSYGVVAASTLYTIKGPFPAAEGYGEITAAQYMTGGEAANSSIVLARLGARIKLDGSWLGSDESGARTRRFLEGYGIDTSRLVLNRGGEGAREVVFAAGGTRTIFGTYGHLLEAGNWNMPVSEDVLQAQVVCLDPFFREASMRVAVLGSEAGIPVVTVDIRHGSPLLRYSSAIVISESFLCSEYPGRRPEEVFPSYQASSDGLVVFTFGAADTWYARRGQAIRTRKPYRVDAVDTCGAGDSFRAGIVYGYLHGWDDEQMIDFASALAAIVCTRTPGVLDAPGYDEVLAFMNATGA
jgi:sugar/nucleoside kinase (ribokinase family)